MPLLNTVTTPYADAFLQVCKASGELDTAIAQCKDLLSIWHSSKEFRDAMGSPVLEVEAKKAALIRMFGEQLCPSFLNLLKLLADRQRIAILDAVLQRMIELYREQNNISLATVTSASPLSDEQREQLAARARVVAGTDKVEIEEKLDPSLIGGFILKVGSQVIDASLAGQVRRLGLSLARVT
jgi:F-type H+-transporting ATPase subunit delta